jgi:hypothetical protein
VLSKRKYVVGRYLETYNLSAWNFLFVAFQKSYFFLLVEDARMYVRAIFITKFESM